MKIIWTDKLESMQKTGIHLYDQTLLKQLVIPYVKGKLRIKRIIYIHDIETDKKYEVVDTPENKQVLEKNLVKVFSKEYKEEQPKRWIKPIETEKKPIPTYELDEDDWKKPKKRGGMNKWI